MRHIVKRRCAYLTRNIALPAKRICGLTDVAERDECRSVAPVADRSSLHRWRQAGPLLVAMSLLWLLMFPLTVWAQGIIYVTPGGGGSGGGWSDAIDMQAALNTAGPGDKVWVAKGVYTPGGFAGSTFQMPAGVAIYGGFAGTPGSEADFGARDPASNLTVLSGDLFGDDGFATADGVVMKTAGITGTNAVHVVTASGAPFSTSLDGFLITAGNADGAFVSPCGPACGGGLYNEGGSVSLANTTFIGNRARLGGALSNIGSDGVISNSRFIGNIAVELGGAVYNIDSASIFSGVTISNNRAAIGGGMVNDGGSILLTGVSIISNTAGVDGGGLYNGNDSAPVLRNVVIERNVAGTAGGGIMNMNAGNSTIISATITRNRADLGGGMVNVTSNISLTNILVSGNTASQDGGGIYNSGSSMTLVGAALSGNGAVNSGGGILNVSGAISLTNVAASGNKADSGGGMVNANSTAYIQNSIIHGNQAVAGANISNTGASLVTIRYSLVEGGLPAGSVDGGNNLDGATDPLFTRNPDPGDGDWTTPGDNDYGDLRPQAASPVIDRGDNAAQLDGLGPDTATISGVFSDLNGLPRILAVTIITPTVDLGPYETPNTPPSITSSPLTTIAAGSPYTYSVTGADANQPSGSGLSLSLTAGPGWLALDDNGDGSGALAGTPSGGDVGANPVTLLIRDSGGLTETQSFAVSVTPAEPATGSVQGSVMDGEGKGIEGVQVSLDDGAGASAATVRTDTTDAGGEYSFNNLPPGAYTLSFAASGFDVPEPRTVNVAAGQSTSVAPITLLPTGTGEAIKEYLPVIR